MLGWSLLDGALPVLLVIGGVAGLAWLTGGRERRWWTRTVPICVVLSAVVTAALVGYTQGVWQPFPDALPLLVDELAGLAVLALVLLVARLRAVRGWPRRVLTGVAAVVAVTAAVNGINIYYGQFPTLGALLGTPLPHELAFGQLPAAEQTASTDPAAPVDASWHPRHLPDAGAIAQVPIPGTASGFAARPAMIYLPPAYLADPRPRLPVLVLMAGEPGSPADWFNGGALAERADRFAAAHDGLAPIVVVPDPLGATLANPLCVNGSRGNIGTYLDVDVPRWIMAHLQVDQDTRHWAVAGASEGGTCALQTALRDPTGFPTVLDIAGQNEPTVGNQAQTVADVFDGDQRRFHAANPVDELAAHRYPGLAVMLTVSSEDTVYGPQQHQIEAALTGDDVPVRFVTVPGRHGWVSFGPSLEQALPWLATRMHLIGSGEAS